MTIKTASGSVYLLSTKENKIFLMKGMKEYLVEKVSFGIGLPLEIECRELNMITYQESPDTVTIRTTPVVEIEF